MEKKGEEKMLKKKCNWLIVSLLLATGLLATACGPGYNIPVNTPRPSTGPAEDMARVYFMKPGGSWGGAEVFITQEEKVIGYLTNRQVFYVDVTPGKHFFMSVSSNTDGVDAEVAGGKTYYVRLFSAPGAMSIMLGGSEDMYVVPIAPGTEEWDKRLEWVDGGQLVEMNPEKCGAWEAKYLKKNQERLANFRAGKDEFKILTADQGE
jgi:hypothetical protein